MNNIETIAFGAGIVFGSLLLVSVSIVWLRKQAFGLGGSVMTLFGVTLVGLTVWRTVEVKVSEGGLEARFEARLEELDSKVASINDSVETIAGTSADLERNVASLNTSVVANSQQFRVLADSLAQQRAVPPDRAADIRDSIVTPEIDSRVFEERALRLERVERLATQ